MSKVEEFHVSHDAIETEGDVFGKALPARYVGTATDRHDMSILGKKQVLRRQFKFSTMLGFASTVMVAWEFVLLVSPFTLQDGGTAGQYHWVSELAPPNYQKGLSYSVGWLIALGWQTFLCGVAYSTAGLIIGLVKLNNDSYQIQSFHQTLLTMALVLFCVIFNVFLSVRLPLVEALVLVLHCLGVFVVIIPLWIMAPRGNVHDTIFNFTDNGGWGNVGLSSTIGMVPMIGMLIGYDCTVHMSEEVQDASLTVPRVVMYAVASNAVMLLIVGITYIFCLGDLESVLNTPTYQPVIQVFYNATKSKAGTTVMVSVLIIIFVSACVGQVATASRQMWSFARDRGLPGSKYLERVAPGWNIPIIAIIVSAIITSLLSLINIGSYAAFNAFNSLGTTSLLFSYNITIGCLIWRRLYGQPLPARRWSLGKYGMPLNIVSVIFTIPMLFFYVWPLSYPVTPENMNWAIAMFGGVLVIASVYYVVRARKEYIGPVMLVKRE
ncbi:hypothetical protein LTR09_009034 [Extremus antarcticus]|uniref:Amino acid transporter n=1 Tax=Extremus antarcticus TaxID=702011 RepID=A0AAJ0D9A7_9PEZI|nr:hypothetical protein LTR09_009034 [Extremus antarcticus]